MTTSSHYIYYNFKRRSFTYSKYNSITKRYMQTLSKITEKAVYLHLPKTLYRGFASQKGIRCEKPNPFAEDNGKKHGHIIRFKCVDQNCDQKYCTSQCSSSISASTIANTTSSPTTKGQPNYKLNDKEKVDGTKQPQYAKIKAQPIEHPISVYDTAIIKGDISSMPKLDKYLSMDDRGKNLHNVTK